MLTREKVTELFVAALMFLFFAGALVSGTLNVGVQTDVIGVDVYVIALQGVDGSGVDNVSRVVEGVLSACQVDTIKYWTGEKTGPYSPVLGEVKIDVNVTVVDDWTLYKSVVESDCGAIIANAHGEIVPIPSDYAKEDWVNMIAQAMAYRNVTWVHTGGYPFWFSWHQDNGEETWGEEGFKQLMSNIGKNDVTCWPPDSETKKISWNINAQYTLLHGWYKLVDASRVQRGRPLKASNFKDCLMAAIWGYEGGYLTGAIIKFAKSSQENNFGFYVHIGTTQTYDSLGDKTDRDFYRGYVGAAQAIYTSSFRTASECMHACF